MLSERNWKEATGSEKPRKRQDKLECRGGIKTNHMDKKKEMTEDRRKRMPLNEGSQ